MAHNSIKSKKTQGRSYRIARALAQADVVLKRKERIRYVGGARVVENISKMSPNQERINDLVTLSFQESTLSSANYFDLERKAKKELEDHFALFGLNKEDLTDKQIRVKTAAVRQKVDEYIHGLFMEPKIEMSYDDVVNLSGITTGRSFAQTIETVKSVKGKSDREYKRDVVDFETMEIVESSYKSVVDIAEVDIVLEPEIAKHYPELDDFLAAKTMPNGKAFRNKKKYIKRVVFHIHPSALPHVVAQGSDYVDLFPDTRRKYSLTQTSWLDNYVTSMQKAQDYRGLTDFTPNRLQKKFGHNFQDFYEFMRQIFDPMVKDFNANDRRTLSYLVQRGKGAPWQSPREKKNSNQPITMIRLVVEGYEKTDRDGVDGEGYYIALQILANEPALQEEENTILQIYEKISSQLETELPEITNLMGKTVAQWYREAEKELEFENKVIDAILRTDIRDVIYDEELMTIVSDKIDIPLFTKPSDSYRYLIDELKVNVVEETVQKNTLFPDKDQALVADLLKSAIESGIESPIHFYYTMFNYYRAKKEKRKDWRGVINLWLTNGKYKQAPAGSTKVSIKSAESGDIHVGVWDHKQEMFETDLEIIPLSLERMAKLIAGGNAKMYGAL